jgi:hypothetical protein
MSEENVEVIRRTIECLNEWEVAEECYDPEVEWTTQPDSPNYTTYRGVSGLKRSMESVREVWDSIRTEAREFIGTNDVLRRPVALRASGTQRGRTRSRPSLGVLDARGEDPTD